MNHKLAFVFPGQGSQSVGMLAELAEKFPQVQETFAQASSVLGMDLWELTQRGPQEKLDETHITQPAMLTADIAAYRCWQQLTALKPNIVAGHSLGEYAALVVAGVLEFTDALQLVSKRGQYMQAATPVGQGAMAALIGLTDEKVVAVCQQAAEGEILAPANFNSVGQTVIAGEKSAVERALLAAKTAGAKIAKLIPVSVPSHCPLMQPAAERLADDLAKTHLQAPTIPVLHNVDVKTHADAKSIRQVLVDQLVRPVRWVETVHVMQAQSVTAALECGPGKVLAGLIKRIDKSLPVFSASTPVALEQFYNLEGMLHA